MGFCPQCGYEYREGVRTCPDCGQELASEPAEEERVPDEPLVEVYEAPDEALSRAMKEALQEAGVPVVEQVDRAWAFDSLDLSVFHGRYSRLLTLESRAEQAREVVEDFLAAYQRGDLALPAEEAEASGEEEE